MSKVLIVDDALFTRRIIKETLEKNGHQVIGQASNGVEAIEMYKQLRPDLVTMDLTMPYMDGINSIKHIKTFDSTAKIIMCSALELEAKVIQAIQAGAEDFVVKPFKEKKLIDSINKIIG